MLISTCFFAPKSGHTRGGLLVEIWALDGVKHWVVDKRCATKLDTSIKGRSYKDKVPVELCEIVSIVGKLRRQALNQLCK